ncbi:MAG: DUF4064 domain-containing protein [Bacteroidetes bacterium]|nr:DUF4064 domain-containing protein [Bacteroidota bacterium]
MSEFKEYLRLPDVEKATEYTSVLDEHNIPFELEDASQHFSVVLGTSPMDNHFVLKIKDEDMERVEKIFDKEVEKEVKELPPDHYLYTFADKDILDIISNQNDWTKAEVKLAIQIANDRKLDLTAPTIKSAKKVSEKKPEVKLTIESTSSWFWTFGIFTIANGVLRIYNSTFHLPGLTVTEVLNVTSKLMFGNTTIVGFIISLLFAGVLFLIARYSKKNNRKAYLIGIIFLGLDGILTVMTKSWFPILFRFAALWSLISTLVNSYKTNATEASMSSTNA